MKKTITLMPRLHKAHCMRWLTAAGIIIGLSFHSSHAQTFSWAGQVEESTNTISNSITHDMAGNIYVTGSFSGTVDFDPGPGSSQLSAVASSEAFLAKYDADGNYLWAKKILTGSGIAAASLGAAVTTDMMGNVYVTGNFYGTVYFDPASGTDSLVTLSSYPNTFLARFGADGSLIWAESMLGLGAGGGKGCVADRSGNIYITGIFDGTVNFDPAGTAAGTVTAVSQSTTNLSNLFLAKYSPEGHYIWAGQVGGSKYAQGLAIAVDTNGSDDKLLLTGFFVGTADFDMGVGIANLTGNNSTTANAFIAKYDTNGAYIWAKGILSAITTNRGPAYGIAVDTQSNVLITGTLKGNSDFDPGPDTALLSANGLMNMFLAKYDQDGNYLWAEMVDGPGSESQGRSLALDQTGNAYVAGYFGGASVDFDPGEGTAALTPGGFYDVFVAKYGTCGNYISAVNIPTPGGLSYGYGIAVGPDGNAYTTGFFTGTADFDPGPDTFMLNTSGTSAFISKLHYADSVPTSHLTVTACQDSFTLNEQTYTASGIYQQLVPGITQCDSIIILNLTLAPVATPVITVNGFILGLTNSYATYQWIENGLPVTGATAATYTVTENGDYRVAVANEAGCTDTSDVYTVTNATGLTGISSWGKQVRIYPNPTGDMLYISSPISVNVLLSSIDGRIILKQQQVTAVSLKGLAEGVYILRLTDKGGATVHCEKVVKQ